MSEDSPAAHVAGRLDKMRKAVRKYKRTRNVTDEALLDQLQAEVIRDTGFYRYAKTYFASSTHAEFRLFALVAVGAIPENALNTSHVRAPRPRPEASTDVDATLPAKRRRVEELASPAPAGNVSLDVDDSVVLASTPVKKPGRPRGRPKKATTQIDGPAPQGDIDESVAPKSNGKNKTSRPAEVDDDQAAEEEQLSATSKTKRAPRRKRAFRSTEVVTGETDSPDAEADEFLAKKKGSRKRAQDLEPPHDGQILSTEDKETMEVVVREFCQDRQLTLEEFRVAMGSADSKKSAERSQVYQLLYDALPNKSRTKIRAVFRRTYHPYERGKFTAEEEELLRQLVEELGQNFREIGQRLSRFPEDVRDHWRNKLTNIGAGRKLNKGIWTVEEERKLREAVFEAIKPSPDDGRPMFDTTWELVSAKVGTRGRVQCRDHFYVMLNKGDLDVPHQALPDQLRNAKRIPAAGAAGDEPVKPTRRRRKRIRADESSGRSGPISAETVDDAEMEDDEEL
ncbi:RNA polymerase I enhancer binding protein [Savitreella phatthalungensis]